MIIINLNKSKRGAIMSEDFIQALSIDEKIVFIKSFIYLACSDGNIEDSERYLLKEIIAIYNLSNELAVLKHKEPEDVILSEIKEKITTRKKALYLIKELLTLANIDENLENIEISFIEKTAQILNIEEEKVLQINELILERKLWLHKQNVVMEETSSDD